MAKRKIEDIGSVEGVQEDDFKTVKPSNTTYKKIKMKRIIFLIFVVLMISGISGTVYFYNKYQNLKKDPNVELQKETKRLVGILGKIIELPKDEMPTVATISDKDKLKDQSFFAGAENGDILFAYTTSMKAILYRPSTNKIINVAPININQAQDVTKGVKTTTTPTPDKKQP